MTAEIIVITFSCFVAGAVLMALASAKVAPEIRRQRWLKFTGYLVIVHLVLGSAVLGHPWLLILTALILAVGGNELHRAMRSDGHRFAKLRWKLWLAYAALSGAFLFAVWRSAPEIIAFLYLVVASFDGFSQVTGQLFGRHRIAPLVSPGKTIEGLIGGTVAAITIAWIFAGMVGLSTIPALITGVVIALCGLAGDLCASWVKRRAGIKNFGTLIPAHGGILDRFDSFIAAGALVGPALLGFSLAPS